MKKFKKGDKVIVTAGKDKGRESIIERVMDQKVLLPGINIFKKHLKATLAADKKGGIYEIPRPVNVAKIALICPNCKKVTRVGLRKEGDKTQRYCKKCDRNISEEKVSKK